MIGFVDNRVQIRIIYLPFYPLSPICIILFVTFYSLRNIHLPSFILQTVWVVVGLVITRGPARKKGKKKRG